MSVRATFRVDVQLADGSSPAVWTSLGSDVIAEPGIHFVDGNQQNGPLDHIAAIGQLEFSLRNDAGNSGHKQGYYSPTHTNCRPGWQFNIPCRVVSTYQSAVLGDVTPQDRVLWTGKITGILPSAGKYLNLPVAVVAQDCMADLAYNDVHEITPQIDQAEDDLLSVVLAAMPVSAQPTNTDLDPGLDVFPYTFDNVGSGVKAMSAMTDVVLSAYGWLYPQPDGTLRYENRHVRAVKSSQFVFDDATLVEIAVPSDRSNVYNKIQVTIHPRAIDAVSDTVLISATGSIDVAPGETIDNLIDNYRDPTNSLQLIGGTGFVTPLVAGTDYVANSQSDGLGADLTADVTVTVTPFAASALFTITNTGTVLASIVTRQLRGKGIYDNSPLTFETTVSPGDRPLPVDLIYQGDANIAKALADYIANTYSSLLYQADDLSFDPQRSDALMTQALTREIGDLITASETVTGLASAPLFILGRDVTIVRASHLRVRYITSYAGSGMIFILDDAVHGVLDSAQAPLGYA